MIIVWPLIRIAAPVSCALHCPDVRYEAAQPQGRWWSGGDLCSWASAWAQARARPFPSVPPIDSNFTPLLRVAVLPCRNQGQITRALKPTPDRPLSSSDEICNG